MIAVAAPSAKPSAEQHIGGEDRIARLDENRKTQDHVRQRTEGGGGDGQRDGDEIGRISRAR